MYESPQLIPSTKKKRGKSLFSIVLEARMPKTEGAWRLEIAFRGR